MNRSLMLKKSSEELPKETKKLEMSLSLPRDKHWDTGSLKTSETFQKKSEKYLLKSRGHIPKEYLDLIGEVASPEESPRKSYDKVPFTR